MNPEMKTTFLSTHLSYKEMKTVRIQDLAEEIKGGWILCMVFQESAATASPGSAPCPGGNNDRPCIHGSYSGCYQYIDVSLGANVTSTYAVLGRGGTDADKLLVDRIHELEEAHRSLNQELRNAEEEGRKFANDYLKANRDMERMADIIETLHGKADTANDMLAEATLHAQRMESDLAKVREHVGKRAFEEALAAETKKS